MPVTSRRTDVAVIGLGAVGAAILYQLARRGVRVLGLDRFSPPHTQGSSHGETRITREGVGEGEAYRPLVWESHRIWRDLEARTGEKLLTACGLVLIAPADGASLAHGRSDFVGRSAAAARAGGIAHEVIDAAELARRFPHFAGLRGGEQAYLEPGGGYVAPERCIAAQLRLAAAHGAEIRTDAPVRALRPEAAGVRVETDAGAVTADRVVVAAGAWLGPLLGPPFDALLTVNRQVLHWFPVDPGAPFPARAPAFIWIAPSPGVDFLYGFPPLPGEARVKLGTEQFVRPSRAEEARAADPAEAEAFYASHVAGRLAGVAPGAVASAACLYTVTPDRDFLIDDHPESDRILAVSACSGHGFKHSAGLGAALAERLVTGRSPVDLAPFGLARFR
ncbi:Sarcosine oxidase [Methylobacterium sp. 4-46]|uniref:N-methyl-L-tryptophan oxidase n=1 Tax=unclassified Methylobacterium TaxID=2615210 RepID=UPI000152C81A|nr:MULTISPECIES: N-methyl-L-tryptophan oxidase [Methylobacterium]ACA17116.1 Sarcosine oxidase [Methylobacterium sp. 4-46]WFT82801.1 N-methyl-L-tryptophan oxidase [Methylobacterium nodulans]